MIPTEPLFMYLLDLLDATGTGKPLPDRIVQSSTALLTLSRRLKISPWITFQAVKLWDEKLSPPVREAFISEFEHNRERSAAMLIQIRSLAELLRETGISVMFIKGAAVLIRGFYPFGCRFMADIDILVHEDDAAHCIDVLHSAGYTEAPEGVTQVHHAPLLIHPSLTTGVEVHIAPYPMLPHELNIVPRLWECARMERIFGVTALVPSDTDHAWILMRTDPLSRPYMPRIGDAIELASLLDTGTNVDFDILNDRSIRDAMPGIYMGMRHACSRFFGFSFIEGKEFQYDAWEDWSCHCIRKWDSGARFRSARERYTALRFYPDREWKAKMHFLFRMLRSVGFIDRFSPGGYREPSSPVKMFRAIKVLLGLVLIGAEYVLFMSMKKRKP